MLKHLRHFLCATLFATVLSLGSCEWQDEPQPTTCNLCEFKEPAK